MVYERDLSGPAKGFHAGMTLQIYSLPSIKYSEKRGLFQSGVIVREIIGKVSRLVPQAQVDDWFSASSLNEGGTFRTDGKVG